MDFRLSQITISKDCAKSIEEIKIKKKHRFLVLRLNEYLLEVVASGGKEEQCVNLLAKIWREQPQYVLYRYRSELALYDDKCVLLAWIPKNSGSGIYSSALMFVKHVLGVENMLVITDTESLDATTLESRIKQCLDCSFNKNIVRVPPIPYVPDSRGLGWVYYQRMLKNKDKVALIEGLTGETITYGVLLERAVSLAVSLRKKGVAYGDVVAYHGPDQINCSVVYVATFFLGAIICSVDAAFSREDTAEMFKFVMPKKVFVAPELVRKIVKVLKDIESNAEIIVLGETKTHASIWDLLVSSADDRKFMPVEVESILDTAVIVFTSGSTGVPKPVCHNHSACLYQYTSFIDLNFCWDRIQHYATPHWTIFSMFLGLQILQGVTRILYPSVFETLWHFARYNPTVIFLSPVEALTLCKNKKLEVKINLNEVKVVVGGNTVDEQQSELLYSVFPKDNIFFGYGFSEIPSGMTSFRPYCHKDLELKRKNHLSVGKALPGFSFKIVDPETEEILGANKQGEIRIQTSFFTSGYWKGDALSLWDSYGWMKTGDLAIYDENHCLQILGRLKDLFKYQDFHIIPANIEKVLREHPAVLHTAVIGKPNLIDGHHPMGVVILKPDYYVSPDELVEFVDQRVHYSQKLRGGVKVLQKMPLSASGKVRKAVLTEMFSKEL